MQEPPMELVDALRDRLVDANVDSPEAMARVVRRHALSARSPAKMPPWAALFTYPPDSPERGYLRDYEQFEPAGGWYGWHVDRHFVAAVIANFVCGGARASMAAAVHIHGLVEVGRTSPPDCIVDFVARVPGGTPVISEIAGVVAYLPLVDGSVFATFDGATRAALTAGNMRSIVTYFTHGRGVHEERIAAYFNGPEAPFAPRRQADPDYQATGVVPFEEAYVRASPLLAAVFAALLGFAREGDDVAVIVARLATIVRLDRTGFAHEHLLIALASLRSSARSVVFATVLDRLVDPTGIVGSTRENDLVLTRLWYVCARSRMSGLFSATGSAPVDVRFVVSALEQRFARTPSMVGWSGIDILWGLSSPTGRDGHPDEARALAFALVNFANGPVARLRAQAVQAALDADVHDLAVHRSVIVAPVASVFAILWNEHGGRGVSRDHDAVRFVNAIYPMLALTAMGVRRTTPAAAVMQSSPLSSFVNGGGWYAEAAARAIQRTRQFRLPPGA